jgi:ubiquitin-protein ligase
MITPIYHPNIDDKGLICGEMIGLENWNTTIKLSSIIEKLWSIIISPNTQGMFSNIQAGKDFGNSTWA